MVLKYNNYRHQEEENRIELGIEVKQYFLAIQTVAKYATWTKNYSKETNWQKCLLLPLLRETEPWK